MSKKDDLIKELQQEVELLQAEYEDLSADYRRKCNELYNQRPELRPDTTVNKRKRKYFGSVAVDFWPLSDWTRLSYKGFEPGHYWQLTVGPLRIDFAED